MTLPRLDRVRPATRRRLRHRGRGRPPRREPGQPGGRRRPAAALPADGAVRAEPRVGRSPPRGGRRPAALPLPRLERPRPRPGAGRALGPARTCGGATATSRSCWSGTRWAAGPRCASAATRAWSASPGWRRGSSAASPGEHLAGQTVLIAHGDRERMTVPAASPVVRRPGGDDLRPRRPLRRRSATATRCCGGRPTGTTSSHTSPSGPSDSNRSPSPSRKRWRQGIRTDWRSPWRIRRDSGEEQSCGSGSRSSVRGSRDSPRPTCCSGGTT